MVDSICFFDIEKPLCKCPTEYLWNIEIIIKKYMKKESTLFFLLVNVVYEIHEMRILTKSTQRQTESMFSEKWWKKLQEGNIQTSVSAMLYQYQSILMLLLLIQGNVLRISIETVVWLLISLHPETSLSKLFYYSTLLNTKLYIYFLYYIYLLYCIIVCILYIFC